MERRLLRIFSRGYLRNTTTRKRKKLNTVIDWEVGSEHGVAVESYYGRGYIVDMVTRGAYSTLKTG